MISHEIHCAINATIVAIVLNLVLPMLVRHIATQEEINPKNGAKSLSFKGQLVHMMVHHAQVPLSSSVIIAVITFLSVYLGYKLKISESLFGNKKKSESVPLIHTLLDL